MATPPKHINNGSCDKCVAIANRYPGFHADLFSWFRNLQKQDPTAHISCAGRGKEAQEDAFAARTSRAHYGQSAHNYNAALDLFRLTQDSQLSYERSWFDHVVAKAVKEAPIQLSWYGAPGSPYFELPHVEVKNFKQLVAEGKLKLVE